tara:strand:- start:3737 stop:4093 length:357 start_codon:yes stop_codon:yes gene_type:complete
MDDNKIYEIYANNELWDKTSCPFGTEVLNREAYDINMGELDSFELCDQLEAAKIEYNESKDALFVETQWEDDDYKAEHEMVCIAYIYDGYVYTVKTAWIDGCGGYTMTREPQFNKKYL